MDDPTAERSMTGARDEVRDQVLEDHGQILGLVRRIEGARDVAGLLRGLQEFRSVLEGHFLAEEAPDGFYETVREVARRHLDLVAELESEHQTFLADIDRIAGLAQACLGDDPGDPAAEVFRQAMELTRRVHAHERREIEVLMDEMYTDLGQGS
jgi:hypothetical protein